MKSSGSWCGSKQVVLMASGLQVSVRVKKDRGPDRLYDWSRVSDDDSFTMTTESDDVEIPVWVGGVEKWVTGLTKRTTCDDVIYALLCHEGNPQGFVDVPSFVICEQWKGVERQLNGRTKINKLWRTWGSDARNVRFLMRKVESATSTHISSDVATRYRRSRYHPQNQANSQEYRHIRVSKRDTNRNRDYSQQRGRSQSKEDVVRRRSRSVEPRSGHREPNNGHPAHHELEDVNQTALLESQNARALQQLTSVLTEQERKLDEQQGRLREIDVQIENYESKMHFLRIQKNGQNYVQEAYLRDRSDESSSSGGEESYVSAKAREMENYLDVCESLLQVEDRITTEHSKIDDLSLLLCEQSVLELSLQTGRSRPQDVTSQSRASMDRSLEDELDAVRSDLHKSFSMGMAQQMEILAVSQTLGECELQLQEKTVLMNSLLLQAEQLDLSVETDEGSDSGLAEGESPLAHTPEDSHNDVFGINTAPRDTVFPPKNSTRETNERHVYNDHPVRGHPHPSPPTWNMDSSILTDLHSRSRMESQTSDWDWENELPLAPQKNLPARNMIPYRTYTTYEDSVGLAGLGLPNSLKHIALDDSNSDTGLSSLHSDEAPPVLETLV